MTTTAIQDSLTATIASREAQELTTRLVATPSQCGIDDEAAVAGVLRDILTGAGIGAELHEVSPGRPNLVARIPGRGEGPALMLNGHLDTTPLDGSWDRAHTVTVEGGTVVGHGARNMKGGLAAITLALLAWRRSRQRPAGDLLFTAVMGHHDGGVGTRALLKEIDWPEHTVIPEPTDLGVRTVQTGSLALRVTVSGRTGPVGDVAMFERYGTADDAPRDPVAALGEILRTLETVPLTHEPDPRLPELPLLQVRHVQGGYGEHLLPMAFAPDRLELSVGAFTVGGQRPETVTSDVRRHLRERLAPLGLAVEVTPVGRFRDLLDVPADAPVVTATCEAHARVAGGPPPVGALLPHSYFGCDAQILAMRGLDAISYGPASHAYRYGNRGRADVADIVACARTLALTPLHLAREAGAA